MSAVSTRDRLFGALAALPTGTVPVAVALVVSGLGTYGFQIVAFRQLGAEPYAALNGLWVLAFILAPGLFLPLEQEVARALAHRRARGDGGRPLIAKALLLGAGLVVGVILFILILRGPIEERLFRSQDGLIYALIAVLIGFALMSLTRGILSGNGRFGRYGLVVGTDGISRVLLAFLLGVIGFSTLGWFGVIFAAAPYLAVVAGLIGARRLAEPGSPAAMSELTTAMGWLLLGSVFAQALSYAAYVGASLLATPAQDAQLGAFIAALFIARIPLLLFQAVQAALLPKLAGLLSRGQIADFKHGFGRMLMLVTGASIVGVILALTVGPAVGRILFGENFTIGGPALAALTAGVCLVVISLTFAQALIALRRYAIAPIAWMAGFGVFVGILLATDGNVFTRAEIAFVVAGAVVAISLAVANLLILRRLPPGRERQGSPA